MKVVKKEEHVNFLRFIFKSRIKELESKVNEDWLLRHTLEVNKRLLYLTELFAVGIDPQ